MADRRQLAQGLMMMTPAMREDLAGREQDIQRGKTVELLRRAGKEMYDNPIVNTAIGFTPVLGDVQAAGETMSALERGAPWQETAGYAAGMLPFVPMIGKTVWHGSPHTFDKFDLSKIGTGEGAQAYGHGLYFAEAPTTAETYQKGLSDFTQNVEGKAFNPDDLSHRAALSVFQAGGDKAKAIKTLEDSAKSLGSRSADWAKNLAKSNLEEAGYLRSNESIPAYAEETLGSLYKVDLPDEQIAKMLDWDKPLSEQPEVYSAIQKYAQETQSNPEAAMRMLEGKTAGEAYQMWNQPEYVSQFLNEQGVPGIQYLDQASRANTDNFIVTWPDFGTYGFKTADEAKAFVKEHPDVNLQISEPTRNYVVFSDEIPQILERNNVPVNK